MVINRPAPAIGVPIFVGHRKVGNMQIVEVHATQPQFRMTVKQAETFMRCLAASIKTAKEADDDNR